MKRIMTIFGWILVAGLLGMAYLFASQYFVSESDFTSAYGILAEDVEITVDESGRIHTSLRLKLIKDPKTYSLAGKLLALAKPEIYQLKKGDAVQLKIKKEDSQDVVEQSMDHLVRIWGIGFADQPDFLSLKQSMDYAKHPRSMIWAVLFFLMAGGLVYYLLR